MKKPFLAVVAAASLFTLTACGSNGDETIVAKTSSGEVTKEELYNELKARFGEPMLRQLVIEEVLSQKYEVSKKEIDEEVNKLKEQYGDQFAAALQSSGFKDENALRETITLNKLQEKAAEKDVKITEDDIKKAYEEQKANPERQASHILVKTEEEAKKVQKELNSGAKFEDLAKKYSTDPGSKDKGGDLGYFGKGVMVPAFEEVAFKLKEGEVSDIVKSDFGYHIIKLTGIKEVEAYDKAKDQIKADLTKEKMSPEVIQAAVDKELKEANIKIEDKDLKDTFKSLESK